MGISICVDGYFGDGGKGQFGSIIAEEADVVARAGGGPNSGQKEHTGKTRHNLPIGMESERVRYGVIGSQCLVDPEILQDEFRNADGRLDRNILRKLRISDRAEILLPSHVYRDIQREKSGRGVGSTKRGISPATEDRGFKIGLRFWHLSDRQMTHDVIKRQLEHHCLEDRFDPEDMAGRVIEITEPIMGCVTDTSLLLADLLDQGKKIYVGGHQGGLLDWIYGTVPFSTSMGTTAPDMLAGLGVGLRPAHVTMILKANPTRVGAGPQVAEIIDYRRLNKEVLDFVCARARITREQLEELDNARPVEAGKLRKRHVSDFALAEDERWVMEHARPAHAYAKGERVGGEVALGLMETLGTEDPARELMHIIGKYITVVAQEFGASTGRPRRQAVPDFVAWAHASRINNPDSLALTKLDCLRGVQPLPVCVAYEIPTGGEMVTTDVFPASWRQLEAARPVFKYLDGFDEDISSCRQYGDLSAGAKQLVSFIEEKLHRPVDYIGVGTGAENVILRKPLNEFYR
ncbi:adenylosuccinate synthetase [Candidatus Woesearchaeota archaeon]|nr:adenylosuccinate synthetase [Candidatus Woesearchaeota archaeon]